MYKLSDVKIEKPITFLVDGSGEGIKKDAPVFIVDTKMCSLQAKYFAEEVFPKTKRIPNYVLNDVGMFYPSCTVKKCEEMIEDCRNNAEFSQILGLITVAHGVLSQAKKMNAGIQIYFEHPECHLHPNRQSVLAEWILSLHTKYSKNDE